jgi:hypothetical protein
MLIHSLLAVHQGRYLLWSRDHEISHFALRTSHSVLRRYGFHLSETSERTICRVLTENPTSSLKSRYSCGISRHVTANAGRCGACLSSVSYEEENFPPLLLLMPSLSHRSVPYRCPNIFFIHMSIRLLVKDSAPVSSFVQVYRAIL